MVTDIETYVGKNYIVDESSVYRWNIESSSIQVTEGDPITVENLFAGEVPGITSEYMIKNKATITHQFSTYAHYLNWVKARGYWRKNGLKLTLYGEIEAYGTNNVFIIPTYDDPTTTASWTGALTNIRWPRAPGGIMVTCDFIYLSSVN